MIEKKKSYAKGMGLKSTIVSDSKVYMTTFADGGNAKLEKLVEDNSITCLNDDKEAFSAEIADKNAGYKITNKKFGHPKGYDIVANNPRYTAPVQQDMLGMKEILEKRYFGETANGKDNICIQVIHNILDIEKILAEYITNAAYAVNNVAGQNEDDIIGFGPYSPVNTYDVFANSEKFKEFDDLLNNPRIGYFGKAFFYKGRDEKTKKETFLYKDDIECYHMLALLSGLRNWVVHNNEDESRIDRKWLYNLDKQLDAECIKTLNIMFNEIADELTRTFSKNSAANVNYIAETLNIDPNKFAEQYFRFSIMKEQKNLGFTLTKLREIMLDRSEMTEIRDNHRVFDSIRSKLYTMMDFVIYKHYSDEAKRIEAENKSLPDDKKKLSEKDIFVISLRGSFSEEQKEKLYMEEADRLWKILGDSMLNIKKFRGDQVKSYKSKRTNVRRILPEAKDISTFSKLMYALTMFLDGKEINDLLTTLINKFDNIQCMLKIMPLIGVKAKFVPEYAFFNNSEKIADELKLIKSFARMGEPVANAKRSMMIDAIKILGTDLDNNALKKLADSFSLDANGKPLPNGKHGMRNFIVNNVISNKRFHYLIRYGDPSSLHEIAKNEAVVKFVLGRIANLQEKQGRDGKNQIDRYYEICISKNSSKSVSEKIDALTKVIVNMNYDQFETKRSILENTGRDNAEREKYKKIISLYLTVIYHILKNLVNINSRYVIAFHCMERDAQLYNVDIKNRFTSVTKYCLGVPEGDSETEKEMEDRAKASFAELEAVNPKLYAHYIKYSDEKKAEEFKRQINREKAKTARNSYLRNTKWNVILRRDLRDLGESKLRVSEFRNKAAHLEVARYAYRYIGDISEINSYFQLYHYIMQRILIDDIGSKTTGKAKEYFDSVIENKKYNDKLLKLLCLPLGYCLTRYKNLSIEALFDMNEAAKFDKLNKERKKNLK